MDGDGGSGNDPEDGGSGDNPEHGSSGGGDGYGGIGGGDGDGGSGGGDGDGGSGGGNGDGGSGGGDGDGDGGRGPGDAIGKDIVKAVTKAFILNDDVNGSQQNNLSILEYGKELYCKGDSMLQEQWPKTWQGFLRLLKEK